MHGDQSCSTMVEEYGSSSENIYSPSHYLFRTFSGTAEKANQQIHVAYKGLSQLHQFDNRSAASFSVNLEQNPFPKPDGYVDKRTKAVDKVLAENSGKQ